MSSDLMRSDLTPRVDYPRHFLFLVCAAVVLVIILRVSPVAMVPQWWQFALYGLLHAVALVVAIRGPALVPRRLLFVAAASVLAAASPYLVIHTVRFVTPGATRVLVFAVLALSSAIGAVSYGLLIRHLWLRGISAVALGLIAAGCVAITLLAFVIADNSRSLHAALPVSWWFAFSCGLSVCVREH